MKEIETICRTFDDENGIKKMWYSKDYVQQLKQENEALKIAHDNIYNDREELKGEYNRLKAENENLKQHIEPCYNPSTGELEGYLHNITSDFIKGSKYKNCIRKIKDIINEVEDNE